MSSSTGRETKGRSGFKERFTWLILVVIVPILVIVILLVVTLSVLGVPVWKTVISYVEMGPSTSMASSSLRKEQDMVSTLQRENADLTGLLQSLRQQVATDKQKFGSLQSQVQTLQTQAAGQQHATASATLEANVIKNMDPAQAALLLSKLSTDDAARILAALNPTVAASVLAAMDPTKAGEILSLSSNYASASSNNTTTTQ